MGVFDRIYRNYYSGDRSLARRLFLRLVRSQGIAHWLFGMRVDANPPGWDGGYFDLTTLCLRRVLRKRMKRRSNLKVLEIGVGPFALLSGYVSRRTTEPVDAIEIDAAWANASRRHAEQNGVNVRAFQSDLFSKTPPNKQYDLIFWNGPYNEPADGWLRPLLKVLPDHLSDDGEFLLGYNSWPLPRQKVFDMLANQPELIPGRVYTAPGIKNEVFTIRRRSPRSSKSRTSAASPPLETGAT